MTTLKDLIAARTHLDAEIARARKLESDAALVKVRALVEEFGFTAQQVFPWRPAAPKVQAKYRDEKSGATWTGRGKPPAWIAGKDRDDFLIDNAARQASAGPAPQGPFLAEMAAAAAAASARRKS